MKNTYYLNEPYFNNIIKKYFKKQSWNRITDSSNPHELHHSNFSRCYKCPITHKFNSLNQIGNKANLYDNMGKSIFLPKYFKFNKKNFINKKRYFNDKTYWIIKPQHAMRQQGILITTSFTEGSKHIRSHKYQNWVCQQYISEPLLYRGKKMHLRVYVLAVRKLNNLKVFLYKKGYMYVADKKYKLSDFNNKYIHITSSCNNQEFPSKFDHEYGDKKFNNLVLPQLGNIIRDTISSSLPSFSCPNSKVVNYSCYKLLGYDIIIDKNFKAYIMEINDGIIGMASTDKPGNCYSKNPSLQTPEFKKELMEEVLDIVLNELPNLRNFKQELNYNFHNKASVYTNYLILIGFFIIILFIFYKIRR